MDYLPRIVDAELALRLASSGAVVIEGPKACGKTATARQMAASEVLLDVDINARQAIAVDPSLVLEGEVPRLVDEWQVEPTVWNHIRRTVDDRGLPGQFILTGSAVPADDITRHTGAGRISRLRMRPMSLFETEESTGTVSLQALLDGTPPRSPVPDLEISRIAELVAGGGWPGHLALNVDQSMLAVRGYLEEVRRMDVGRIDGTRRDPDKVGRLLRSLARNTATYVSARTLALDAGGADGALDPHTVGDYLTALDRLMVIEEQPAWAPHLRSRSILRSAPKRHFVDPSLAVAALGGTPQRLLDDLTLFGFFFESLVIRDLRVYSQAFGGRVSQYRDNTGLEVDAIVESPDGRWVGIEVKLGAGLADEGAANLLRFAERVDKERTGEPSALVVIVGTGFGYVREDGVGVVPIGALGP